MMASKCPLEHNANPQHGRNFPSEARAKLPYSLGRFCDMVSTGSDEDNVSNVRYHNDINRTITDLREFVIQMSIIAIDNRRMKIQQYWSEFVFTQKKRSDIDSK